MFEDKKTIFGATEKVILPDFASIQLDAKIDTGAWSGALHAENIREINGELVFEIGGEEFQEKNFSTVKVRSASGHAQNRYKIPIRMMIMGREYNGEITLTNREQLTFEMLIGRKFLAENGVLVDVNRKGI